MEPIVEIVGYIKPDLTEALYLTNRAYVGVFDWIIVLCIVVSPTLIQYCDLIQYHVSKSFKIKHSPILFAVHMFSRLFLVCIS